MIKNEIKQKKKIKIYKKYIQKLLILLYHIILVLLKGISYLIIIIFITWFLSLKPSSERYWTETDKILPIIEFNTNEENIVKIKNIRDFKHLSNDKFEKRYIEETFNINNLKRVYYIVEPFSNFEGPAHTMLDFEFNNGKKIVISVETRKEKGEKFNPIKGLLNQYELMYMIGTENDLIRLRTNIRKDIVRMYPLKGDIKKFQELLKSMLYRTNKLSKEPEFYNTAYNNCTTNIAKHVNQLIDNKIPFDIKMILPYYSDNILYDFSLIDSKLPLYKARKFFNISKINKTSYNFLDKEYSEEIRKIIQVDKIKD